MALFVGFGLVSIFFLLMKKGGFSGTGELSANTQAPVSFQPVSAVASVTPKLPAATPTNEPQDTVALVNQAAITRQQIDVAQACDRAVSALLGRPGAQSENTLERLINNELVLQAASRSETTISSRDAQASLQNFLDRNGHTLAELETTLRAEDISLAEFQDYYRHLLLIDQYSRAQAPKMGMTVPEYIHFLQKESRISYGSAVEDYLAEDQGQKVEKLAASEPTQPALQTAVVTSTVKAEPLAESQKQFGLESGLFAPLFALPSVNSGADGDLTLDGLKGRPVALVFFTTWCPYCRRQTPLVVEADQDIKYRDIQFVGIDIGETPELAQDYIQSMGIPYPVVLDQQNTAAEAYQVTGYPTTYFIDAQGQVVDRHIGLMSADTLRGYLDLLVKMP